MAFVSHPFVLLGAACCTTPFFTIIAIAIVYRCSCCITYGLQEPEAAGQDEFPGLAFGIRDMDQRQKFSSADSSQDFPSLGSAAGGARPTGVWGRGAGRLAGGYRLQLSAECQLKHFVSQRYLSPDKSLTVGFPVIL